MNFIQPSKIFIIAFLPFFLGGLFNIYLFDDTFTFIATLTLLLAGFAYLYLQITAKHSKIYFLFFSTLSLFLSITLSAIFLSIEGFQTFDEVQRFITPDEISSDLLAMGPVAIQFFDLLENQGLYGAVTFNWMLGFYNSYLSVFKMSFSAIALPGIGYFSFSIISWWFSVLFFAICAIIYQSNQTHTNQSSSGYFLCFFIPWLIAPFALPNDRELIGILLLGIIGIGFLAKEKLSLLSVATILTCTVLLVFQRYAYAAFVPVIFLFFGWHYLLVRNNITIFPKLYFTNSLKISIGILVLLGLLSVITYLIPFISFLAILDTNFFDRVDAAMTGNADAWVSLSTGIPIIDMPLKILFLILTPFPFYQMFRGDYGWSLNPTLLIPLNILPVYMFGKLYIIIFFAYEMLRLNFTKLFMPILGILFLATVVISDRAGPAYLMPAYACFILWIHSNNISISNFKKTLPIYLVTLLMAHLLYWLIYWKI